MLRNLAALQHLSIVARDGKPAAVQGCYVDTSSWAVRYLIIAAGHEPTQRSVLISPFAVTRLDWERKHAEIALSLSEVSRSPSIDTPAAPTELHLCNPDATAGYCVEAADGPIGSVAGFLYEEQTWTLRHLIIDTCSGTAHRSVLISTGWIDAVSRHQHTIFVSLNSATVLASARWHGGNLMVNDREPSSAFH